MWVWKSYAGRTEPPVKRNGQVVVKNNVLTFPFWVGALLYLALIALAIAVPVYFLGKRH